MILQIEINNMLIDIKHVCCLLCLLFTGFLQAQNDLRPASIQWGEELREPAGSTIDKIIKAGTWGAYVLRRKPVSSISGEQVYIEYYDDKMRLKKSQKLDLKYKGKRREFEDMILLNGQLYLLTSFNNEAKKKNYLFAQRLDKRLLPVRDLTLIGEIDSRDRFRDGRFDLAFSRDSSQVLVYNQLPFQKNEPERFALRVYDDQFQEVWQRDITLPYGDGNFSIEEYRIDRHGNVYLLGVIFQDRSRVRRNGKPTYNYAILAYTEDGERAQEYRIDLEEQFVTDLTFRVANDGNLVCAGFYSDRGTYSIRGTCFFRLDVHTKEIHTLNLKPLDFEFMTEYLPERRREKARRAEAQGDDSEAPELYRFSLDELILRSDGGAVLVAEQYYVYQQYLYYPTYGYRYYPYGTNRQRVRHHYHYNDIIVVNIRPDGEIEWASRIPKRQETIDDGGYYSSYAMATVRDRFFFIYNDNARNFNLRKQKSDRFTGELYNFNGSQSVIALSEVQRDGTVTTYPLFSNRDADVITRPKICRQTGSRRMIVYGERGRTYRFADLEFELPSP